MGKLQNIIDDYDAIVKVKALFLEVFGEQSNIQKLFHDNELWINEDELRQKIDKL